MALRLPPLNSLRAFEASARRQSFSRAAEELHVTPAAVSQQIKGLEKFLGATLFRRTRQTLILTETGQTLLPGIRRGFQAFNDAMEDFSRQDDTGYLTVASTASFAAKWLVPHIQSFNRAHPKIDVRITTSDKLLNYERDGVEIGVRLGKGDYPDLVAELLLPQELAPVCSPALLNRGKQLRKPSDLRYFTLLHSEAQLGNEESNWALWLKAAGVDDIDAARGLRFDFSESAQNAAIEGAGVALGRTALIADDVASGKLVRPFEINLPSDLNYFLVYPEKNLKRPKVKAFRDWVHSEVQLQATERRRIA
ncbi:MAG: transcriptional regulator GcvA [Alphaproteobacteria bacterium]|nr:transcriptional regulator GcvA [Alphaproteobacteria bacterium]